MNQNFFRSGWLLAVFLGAAIFAITNPAILCATEADAYRQAEEYGKKGDLKAMEATYDALLQKNPSDLKARIGRATARSWSGNHEGAQSDYQTILKTDSNHLEARVGLAYDLAWDKKFSESEEHFNKALAQAPDNLSAQKGLGLVYLWSGRNDKALTYFKNLAKQHPKDSEIQAAIGQAKPTAPAKTPSTETANLGALVDEGYKHAWAKRFPQAETNFNKAIKIAPDNLSAQKGLGYVYFWSRRHGEALDHFTRLKKEHPEDSEIQVAIGQINLEMGHPQVAEQSFKEALKIDPLSTDAVQGLRAAYGYPALAELHVWGGNTSGGGDTGIRLVELASWITPKWRVWGRFDNSLSLDNPALARAGLDAETYFAGVMHQFTDHWLGSAEFGWRDLPFGADQQVYKLSGVYLYDNRAVKFGAQVSPHSDGFTDELIFGGYDFPIGNKGFRLEPSAFYSNTGATNDDEWRGVLFGHYKAPSGWSASAGLGGGYLDSAIPNASGSIKVANALVTLPVFGYHSINFSVRYENNPTDEFTVLMAGVSLRWPRK